MEVTLNGQCLPSAQKHVVLAHDSAHEHVTTPLQDLVGSTAVEKIARHLNATFFLALVS